jgi:hypothetical protein
VTGREDRKKRVRMGTPQTSKPGERPLR